MRHWLFLIGLSLFLVACQDAGSTKATTTSVAQPSSDAVTSDFSAYTLSPIAGTDQQLAEKLAADGRVLETGTIANGLKQGSWSFFEAEGYVPKQVITYQDGKKHGLYMELDPFGRITKMAHYKLDELHGPYAEYRASIPQKTANYREGKLHGILRVHTLTNGKVNRSISYKNGVEDGPMRWYNDQEELIQERMYRNGTVVE